MIKGGYEEVTVECYISDSKDENGNLEKAEIVLQLSELNMEDILFRYMNSRTLSINKFLIAMNTTGSAIVIRTVMNDNDMNRYIVMNPTGFFEEIHKLYMANAFTSKMNQLFNLDMNQYQKKYRELVDEFDSVIESAEQE